MSFSTSKLVDGQFVPSEAEADNRTWLSKATLGLLESDAPLPPGETRASQDIIRQYQNALDEIPEELQPQNQDDKAQVKEEDPHAKASVKDRSIWSYMTLGVFD